MIFAKPVTIGLVLKADAAVTAGLSLLWLVVEESFSSKRTRRRSGRRG